MSDPGIKYGAIVVLIALAAVGCGTPKEKSAPCRRPANLASYAPPIDPECGPMQPLNIDRAAAIAAVTGLSLRK